MAVSRTTEEANAAIRKAARAGRRIAGVGGSKGRKPEPVGAGAGGRSERVDGQRRRPSSGSVGVRPRDKGVRGGGISVSDKTDAEVMREIESQLRPKRGPVKMVRAGWRGYKGVRLVWNTVNNALASKKTTIGGIGAVLMAAGLACNHFATTDGAQTLAFLMEIVGAAKIGFGLFSARDNDKSDEQAGAK